jgi:hypothetical protein
MSSVFPLFVLLKTTGASLGASWFGKQFPYLIPANLSNDPLHHGAFVLRGQVRVAGSHCD